MSVRLPLSCVLTTVALASFISFVSLKLWSFAPTSMIFSSCKEVAEVRVMCVKAKEKNQIVGNHYCHGQQVKNWGGWRCLFDVKMRGRNLGSSGPGFKFWVFSFLAVRHWASHLSNLPKAQFPQLQNSIDKSVYFIGEA